MDSITNTGSKPYISCIRVNGIPILPPLITHEERHSLLKHKIEAMAIEEKLKHCKQPKQMQHKVKVNKSMSLPFPSVECLPVQGIKSLSPCKSPRCRKIKRNEKYTTSRKCEKVNVPMEEIKTPRKQTNRRNSYTLESPNPEIIEQLYALQYTDRERLNQKPLLDDVLKMERNKCLRNLNEMNLNSEESDNDGNKKCFIPDNFSDIHENVLLAPRNVAEISHNKLSEYIHFATELLNSISTDKTKHNSSNDSTSRSDWPNPLTSCGFDNTGHNVHGSKAYSNINHNSDGSSKAQCFSLADSIPDNVKISYPASLSVKLENKRNSCDTSSGSSTINHCYQKNRRVWNLPQAKRLWENEVLTFPTRQCHSEPVSRGHTPPLVHSSYSVDFLLKDVTLDSENIKGEDLKPPVYCLERSVDKMVSVEDIDLCAYYLNLFNDMPHFVTQQVELASRVDLNELKPGSGEPVKCNRPISLTDPSTPAPSFPSMARAGDTTASMWSGLATSREIALNPVEGSDLIQFDCDQSVSSLELPENTNNPNDIEEFLLELLRSEEEQLLRKHQKEQFWLQQRQKKLKESVLSLSGGSSAMSSFDSSVNISRSEGENLFNSLAKENNFEQRAHLTSLSLDQLGKTMCDERSVTSSTFDPLRQEFMDRCNVGEDSNKSTPSQLYDSCEEWFTPDADHQSPVSNAPHVFTQEYIAVIPDESHGVNTDGTNALQIRPEENLVPSEHIQSLQETGLANLVLPSQPLSIEMSIAHSKSQHLENKETLQRTQKQTSEKSTVRVLKDIANVVPKVKSMGVNSQFPSKIENMRDNPPLSSKLKSPTVEERGFASQEKYQQELKEIQQGLESLYCGAEPILASQATELPLGDIQGHSYEDQINWSHEHAKTNMDKLDQHKTDSSSNHEESLLVSDIDDKPEFHIQKLNTYSCSEEASVNSCMLTASAIVDQQENQTCKSESAAVVNSSKNFTNPDLPYLSLSTSEAQANTTACHLPTQNSAPTSLDSSLPPSPRESISSVPLSLDQVKQKYLLRPQVMRAQGLQGFETNVISRLQREVNARPKSLIKDTYSESEQRAARTLTAAARGYLVRRLLRTQRVLHIKATIHDSLKCALSLQSDPAFSSSDRELYTRLIQQLTAACYELYDTFFTLSTREKMNIIALDRERQRNAKLMHMKVVAKKNETKSVSEPRGNSISGQGATKAVKKYGTGVKRPKSVSSQDSVSFKSNDSMSSNRSIRTESQSNQQVPNTRRQLIFTRNVERQKVLVGMK